ncbi:MAG: trypsin-like peptidase domain-containing protein [bacterium]|nr:trypsin-like peptidase domain-containing protein [bacterium]
MTTTCLLRVLKDDHEVSRGTAWLVRPQLAVTAFHVVADRERTAWRSDVESDVEYRLGGPDGDGEIVARPAPADPEADLALLRTATPIDQAEVLTVAAEPPAVDARWRTLGYPAVSGRQPFALTGTVTEILPGAAGRRLQLWVDQGTEVRWGGLSGAPVTVGGRVIATVTKEMSKAATLLASPVTRLAHLLRLADAGDLIDDCRELLADVYPPAAIRDLGYLIEELGWRLPPAAWSTPAEVPERISRRAWHGGEHALRELLEEVSACAGPTSPCRRGCASAPAATRT